MIDREKTYGPMAAEYRDKVARALQEGGVDAVTAREIVEYWKDNLRAAWAVAESPRVAARQLAKREGLTLKTIQSTTSRSRPAARRRR